MTQALFCSRSHQSLTQTSWEAWGPGSSRLQGSKWIQLLRVQSVPCFFLLDLLTFFPFLFLRPALVLFFLSQLLHYFLYFYRDIFPQFPVLCVTYTAHGSTYASLCKRKVLKTKVITLTATHVSYHLFVPPSLKALL